MECISGMKVQAVVVCERPSSLPPRLLAPFALVDKGERPLCFFGGLIFFSVANTSLSSFFFFLFSCLIGFF